MPYGSYTCLFPDTPASEFSRPRSDWDCHAVHKYRPGIQLDVPPPSSDPVPQTCIAAHKLTLGLAPSNKNPGRPRCEGGKQGKVTQTSDPRPRYT